MDIAEQFYKEGTPSKTTIGGYSNRASHFRKHKGVEAALLANTEKVRSGKRKTNHACHPSDQPTSAKTCLVHGPGNYTEECKVLK